MTRVALIKFVEEDGVVGALFPGNVVIFVSLEHWRAQVESAKRHQQ